jgi:hypothetical protein
MAHGRKTGGRQKGTPNKATATVPEVFSAFVEANAEEVQDLFDRVAEGDPAKALDLFARLAEFVIPKLARTDIGADSERNAQVVRIEVVGVDPAPRSDSYLDRCGRPRWSPPSLGNRAWR